MVPMSRRAMLKMSAAAGLALTAGRRFAAAGAGVGNSTLAHSILFDDTRLPSMRGLFRDDPRFEQLRKNLLAIDREAERQFIRSGVRLNDQVYDLPRLKDLAESMAFLWLMTGEEDVAGLAAETVRTIMKFPRWDFFQDADTRVIGVQRAPETTVAVALASDWLGEQIAPAERSDWLRTMGERGCAACYRSLYGIRFPGEVRGWSFDPTSTFFEYRAGNRTDLSRRPEITQRTNLRAVPAAGLTIGALALRSHAGPDRQIERWLEMALHSLKAFSSIFEPDGSYHEGVSYANYTALQLASAITALRHAGGPDPGDLINWDGYLDYVMNMSMPTTIDPSGMVNFGDNGNPQTGERGRVGRCAVPCWIARQTRNARAQWTGDQLTGAPDIRTLAWFDPSVEPDAPAPGPRLWRSANDRIVARTGFGVDDLVVAMRSGPPANHEHADRNSLIVKCFGEELVTDPNRPPYSYADPAWMMRLTEAHSAVLVDGRGHQYHNGIEGTNASSAYARILRVEQNQREAWWVSDATQAYRLVDTDIRSVVRGVVVLFELPAVVVVDRVTKWESPSSVQARFFGYNWDGNVGHELRPDGFLLRRPQAQLRATVLARQPTTILLGRLPIPGERALRHPFVEVSTRPAVSTTIVTVLAIGRKDSAVPTVALESSEEEIRAQVRQGDRAATLRIADGESVPVVSISS